MLTNAHIDLWRVRLLVRIGGWKSDAVVHANPFGGEFCFRPAHLPSLLAA